MQKKYSKIVMGTLLIMVLFLSFSSPTAEPLYASTATYPYYVEPHLPKHLQSVLGDVTCLKR